ncbi:hypothetical protein K457DRAFT_434565 [Linnemannia elongata AG-77]|uniref:Uncharacterized protein n=1 Tax=Linnemannia elongata AG-77 TaxID=1314771 RepID=A0A197JZA7_9FUNG|nr:hypothetical protein K457DRAFT_434565 [Linnemannia elongata AG-77]
MGNVSSADNDRVNELLTRRAKKKLADRNNKQKQLQEQQLQQQQRLHPLHTPHDPYLANSDSLYSNGGVHSTPSHPMLRQKSTNKCHPLDQAEFYGAASSEWSNISYSTSSHSLSSGTTAATHNNNNNNRNTDYFPQSPASPSFSIPSSATTPTSATYIDGPYLSSRFEDRHLDPVSVPPSSPQQRRPPAGSQLFPDTASTTTNTATHQYHTSPIVIPQHRYSQLSISSLDDGSLNSNKNRINGPASPAYQPPRRGSEHHILHQLQQQLSADLRLLGTSPEAKDWLRQKPTRSSTHMIHQYNFHPHQYYQQPGSIAVKVVNNTCRNMGDYPNVPSLPSLNARPSGPGSSSNGRSKSYSSKGSASTTLPSIPDGSVNATTASGGSRPAYTSEPIPTPSARARGMSQPEMTGGRSTGAHDDNSAGTSDEVHAHYPAVQGPRTATKLVMSRSKLVSPLAASLPALPSSSNAGSSTSITTTSDGAANGDAQFTSGEEGSLISSKPRTSRPSSTLSSLRSLLGNHPQGLSLIESLEEEEYSDTDSLSDTETGDSEGDLIQRTESLVLDSNDTNNNKEKRSSRRRPPPQFDWMAARRRFSSSSLSTISRDIQDRYSYRTYRAEAHFLVLVQIALIAHIF